jgi:hypothetical protein
VPSPQVAAAVGCRVRRWRRLLAGEEKWRRLEKRSGVWRLEKWRTGVWRRGEGNRRTAAAGEVAAGGLGLGFRPTALRECGLRLCVRVES